MFFKMTNALLYCDIIDIYAILRCINERKIVNHKKLAIDWLIFIIRSDLVDLLLSPTI